MEREFLKNTLEFLILSLRRQRKRDLQLTRLANRLITGYIVGTAFVSDDMVELGDWLCHNYTGGVQSNDFFWWWESGFSQKREASCSLCGKDYTINNLDDFMVWLDACKSHNVLTGK